VGGGGHALGGRRFKVGQGRYHPIDREWSGTTALTLRLPLKVRITQRYNKAISVERGPLVYSLRIGESWKKIGGEEPHANWEVHPTTPWNYGLLVDRTNPERSFEVVEEKPSGNPFDSKTAPVRLVAKGRLVPDWTLARNAAAPPPHSPVKSSQPLETITLIPYGAAKLRITEFPALEE